VILYGGEPLINERGLKRAILSILSFVERSQLPKKTDISIITNGTLLTREIAVFLKEHGVTVVISIDGPAALNLNRSQSHKTVRAIFAGMELLHQVGAEFGISCTLGEESLRDFDQILEWIDKTPAIKSVGFNIVRPIPPYAVSDDYGERVAKALISGFEHLKRRGIYEDRMGRKFDAFVMGNCHPYDCAGCGSQIVVSPKGSVGICAGFLGTGKYFITDVKEQSFDFRGSAEFKYWGQRSPLNIAHCFSCPALAICGGGCPYYAEIKHGNLYDIDEVFCVHAKRTLEYLIWTFYKSLR